MVNGFHFCTFFYLCCRYYITYDTPKRYKKKFQIENKRAVKKEKCRPIVSRDPF